MNSNKAGAGPRVALLLPNGRVLKRFLVNDVRVTSKLERRPCPKNLLKGESRESTPAFIGGESYADTQLRRSRTVRCMVLLVVDIRA
jgi:hypothetical protein